MPLAPYGQAPPDRRALGQRLMAQMVPRLQSFRQQGSRLPSPPPSPAMPGVTQHSQMPRGIMPRRPMPGATNRVMPPPPPSGAGLSAGLGGSPSPTVPAQAMKMAPQAPSGPLAPTGLPQGGTGNAIIDRENGIGGGGSIVDFLRWLAMNGADAGGGLGGGAASAGAAGNAGGGGMGGFA